MKPKIPDKPQMTFGLKILRALKEWPKGRPRTEEDLQEALELNPFEFKIGLDWAVRNGFIKQQ